MTNKLEVLLGLNPEQIALATSPVTQHMSLLDFFATQAPPCPEDWHSGLPREKIPYKTGREWFPTDLKRAEIFDTWLNDPCYELPEEYADVVENHQDVMAHNAANGARWAIDNQAAWAYVWAASMIRVRPVVSNT